MVPAPTVEEVHGMLEEVEQGLKELCMGVLCEKPAYAASGG